MGGMDEKLPVSDDLVMALGKANTLRGRGRGAGTPVRYFRNNKTLCATKVMAWLREDTYDRCMAKR